MLKLPGLEINNPDTEARLIAAFGSMANYRAWLIGAIKEEVVRRESADLIKQEQAKRVSAETMLDGAI